MIAQKVALSDGVADLLLSCGVLLTRVLSCGSVCAVSLVTVLDSVEECPHVVSFTTFKDRTATTDSVEQPIFQPNKNPDLLLGNPRTRSVLPPSCS